MMYLPRYGQLDRPFEQQPALLFVTFGLFDAMTLSLLGYPAATSTIGKGSFRAEWLDGWSGRIAVLPDLTEEREAHLLVRDLGWRGTVLELPYPEGTKDPNDFYQHDGVRLYELIRNFADRFRAGASRSL